MVKETKNPLRSVTLWGGVGLLWSFMDAWNNIPADLITDTEAVFAQAAALVSFALVVFGRWRAHVALAFKRKK